MPDKKTVVNLRTVADRVGLAPCSVSAVLNNAPASFAIPQRTKDRIFRAAEELNYRPNLWARSLRTKRTRVIAAITSDIGSAPVARVIAGVQGLLHRKGYLLALGAFDPTFEWKNIGIQLRQRGIEGIVAIDAMLPRDLDLPVASVELEYMSFGEPMAEDMRTWLSDLGESAADTIVRQIEKDSAPRRMKVVPRLPSAYFELPANLNADSRESA